MTVLEQQRHTVLTVKMLSQFFNSQPDVLNICMQE